jgi:hypothetical protein
VDFMPRESFERHYQLKWVEKLAMKEKILHLSETLFSGQEDIDQAWSKEAESRFQQLESAQTKLVPGEEVFEKIRKRLAR